MHDPRINALSDKVWIELEPAYDDDARCTGRLVIRLRDGTELSHLVDDMRGTRNNPISRDDYLAKFRANADAVIHPDLIEETVERVLTLERVADVGPLLGKFSTKAIAS